MSTSTQIRFPNETDTYRQARQRLLEAERALRRQTEDVAALRRALPAGGAVADEYIFDEPIVGSGAEPSVAPIGLEDLFADGRDTLVVYNFMFAPGSTPCPMCTSLLDGLNGNAVHFGQLVNFAVVAKATPKELANWKAKRGWVNLRLLSSKRNSYNQDYFGEVDGNQMPMLNVFRRQGGKIVHVYGTELLYTPPEDGQDPRHVDTIWPLWNLLDFTPEGRGSGWYPSLSY